MSLITRCPACKTMFKVVPDQLRISEGWVRCGQCDEIFDAAAQMQVKDNAVSQPQPLVPDVAEPEVAPAREKSRKKTAARATSGPVVQEIIANGTALSDAAHGEPVEPSLDDATLPVQYEDTETLASQEPHRWVGTDEAKAAGELSFMRDAKPVSRWHRPLARIGLMVLSLLLCGALLLQVAVNEHDRIAAMQPGLKPLLEEVCSFMDCTLAPLKQIDSVAIDSSSFNKIRGDVYRLNFVLKNTAPIALALPAIELSITDVHDQPIVRRVFRADELGLKTDVLQATSESNASLTMGIKTGGGTERIAGYRILAFYP